MQLAMKVASWMVRDEMVLLRLREVGYEVCGGAEAAVHAVERFLLEMVSEQEVVKLDFQNVFNSIRQDKLLEITHDLPYDIFFFVHSFLFYHTSLLG